LAKNDNAREGETWADLFRRVLDDQLKKMGKRVVVPDAKEFVGAMIQAHRKGEKAFHVKSFRGAAEGT